MSPGWPGDPGCFGRRGCPGPGRQVLPSPQGSQRTSRPQLADVAVWRRAQVCVALAGRAEPHAALSRGGVRLPGQPVLAALQAEGLVPRGRAYLCPLHSREADPHIQAPAGAQQEGQVLRCPPKVRCPSTCPLWGHPPHCSLSGGFCPNGETEAERRDLANKAHASGPVTCPQARAQLLVGMHLTEGQGPRTPKPQGRLQVHHLGTKTPIYCPPPKATPHSSARTEWPSWGQGLSILGQRQAEGQAEGGVCGAVVRAGCCS